MSALERVPLKEAMSRYAFLILPSFNRVYAEAATGLAKAELEVFNQSVLAGRVSAIADCDIAGVPYVTFNCEALAAREAAFLANLLEEARGHAATYDGVEDRKSVATIVAGARTLGSDEQVDLLAIFVLSGRDGPKRGRRRFDADKCSIH